MVIFGLLVITTSCFC
ncbi:hypothetical protein DVY93_06520 [Psychrobacter sp. CCUG 69069]|nr:hypothetical protein [Psychrobacter sp. CCUG 69069]HCN18387.1 hypothetical protein [Psychrobacter sp.]